MSHDWLEAIINNSNNHCLVPKEGRKRQKFAYFPNLFVERKRGKCLPQNEIFACSMFLQHKEWLLLLLYTVHEEKKVVKWALLW